MKLYLSPGACSPAPHIALTIAGLPFSIERVSPQAPQASPERHGYSASDTISP